VGAGGSERADESLFPGLSEFPRLPDLGMVLLPLVLKAVRTDASEPAGLEVSLSRSLSDLTR